ncbi:hypothetical protein FE257_003736 [Aspergillus nanangensis]|uniref:SGNH hydrolase-type esterase domain-containing protein n=1 Tax=Aspergillus nanangensis TaxID=2582783 RepID=A0AAD4GPG4_ASPNN|nr:hypothetical protein FE257_003736 [Aspergillus nanangensis]
MVGTETNGDMNDNDVEATPGNEITAVTDAALRSVRYKPNVVLINAGTNDCRLGDHIPEVGNRMRKLINTLLDAEDATEAHRNNGNAQYRDLVTAMRMDGVSIVLADMDPFPELGPPRWLVYPDDYTTNGVPDNIHPSDSGYRKMATVWNLAIEQAAREGLIKAPVKSESHGQICDKDFGDGLYAGGLTQTGIDRTMQIRQVGKMDP